MFIRQLDTKHGIRESLDHCAFSLKNIIFRHTDSP
jgi:hypothetical protein